MKFEELKQEQTTREELLKEHYYLDNLLQILERQEEEDKKALRKALDNLNNTQRDLKKTDDRFEKNCFKLQEYGKK